MSSSPSPLRALWLAALPVFFVLLWSTGFVAPKFGLPHATPLAFTLLRFAIVAALFVILSLVTRAPWPRDARSWLHSAVVALVFHCSYVSGVFSALGRGVETGVMALIVGIQPLLTAALSARLVSERTTSWQWLGLGLGLTGLVLVIGEKLSFGAGSLAGYAFALLALAGITLGTLYQKRYLARMDLRTGAAMQYLLSTLIMLVIAPLGEEMQIDWSLEFVVTLSYIAVFVSFAGISVFFHLLHTGQAIRVLSYFYLITPVTTLFGYLLFGETLGILALLGMAIAVAGVALVNRHDARARGAPTR